MPNITWITGDYDPKKARKAKPKTKTQAIIYQTYLYIRPEVLKKANLHVHDPICFGYCTPKRLTIQYHNPGIRIAQNDSADNGSGVISLVQVRKLLLQNGLTFEKGHATTQCDPITKSITFFID